MPSDMSAVVVVGADGSDLSAKAVEWAGHYASATGATVRIVTAWQSPVAYGAPMTIEDYAPYSDAEAVAEKARSTLTLPADRVGIAIDEGPAGPVLVAASKGAAALVVGSQGHSALSKVLLGSVSTFCVHHAGCPVVVVR